MDLGKTGVFWFTDTLNPVQLIIGAGQIGNDAFPPTAEIHM
jgi:hypothetical protein